MIDFDDTSKVAYPLGDPGNAAFDTINAFGGTFISGGVDLGLAELQRDGSPLGNRTGMIVLTDGEDAYLETLILSLNNATALGVRISFGFLQTPGSPVTPPAGLVSAILATGGTFSTIDSAAAQQYFIDLIIANGPTPVDVGGGATGPNGETSILPGLAVAHKLARDPGVYTYNAVAGERLNFTVQSLTNQSLAVALSGHGGADLLTATEGPSWIANVLFTPASDTALKLTVGLAANGTGEINGTYTVGLNSSLAVLNCTVGANKTKTSGASRAVGEVTGTVGLTVAMLSALWVVVGAVF